MTNEEVLKIVEKVKDFFDVSGYPREMDCEPYDISESLGKAIFALEKKIPKKPIRGEYGHFECACCGWVVDTFCGDVEQYPFCPNCGQALDWSDAK